MTAEPHLVSAVWDAPAARRPHCHCVKQHAPSPRRMVQHHILPKEWGGKTEAGNLIWLCDNSHYAVHELLDQYQKANGTPAKTALSAFNDLQRRVAADGWQRRAAASSAGRTAGTAP